MADNNKDDKSNKLQGGSGGGGIFRGKSFSLEFILRWLEVNTDIGKGILNEISDSHNVVGDLEPMVGMWLGDLEPSFKLNLKGKWENVLGTWAEWGHCHGQESVVAVYPTNGGTGFRSTIHPPRSLNDDDLERLTSKLKSELASASFILDDNENVERIEYWATDEDDLENFDAIGSFLQEILSQPVEPSHKKFYTVIPIDEKDYHNYIEASAGDKVVKSDCVDLYQSVS